MGNILNPYLMFRTEARDALEFYRSVFGGELSVMTFGDMGMEGDGASAVMHGQLTTDAGFTLMASDIPPEMELPEGSRVAVSLSGDGSDQLRGYWEGLSEGANVTTPLEKQMWGDVFGQLVDKFGVAWMVDMPGGDA